MLEISIKLSSLLIKKEGNLLLKILKKFLRVIYKESSQGNKMSHLFTRAMGLSSRKKVLEGQTRTNGSTIIRIKIRKMRLNRKPRSIIV